MNNDAAIVPIVLEHYPTTQAIYLFGTYGTPDEWPQSDIDIAILLPPERGHRQPMLTPCHQALEYRQLQKPVDLLSARHVSTVASEGDRPVGAAALFPRRECRGRI